VTEVGGIVGTDNRTPANGHVEDHHASARQSAEQSPSRDHGRHAVVGIVHENDRFLVIRRSPLVRAPGLICFPGGGIEPGEDFETAVRRELMEELQLQVHVHEHLWTSVTRWGTRLEWLFCSRDPNHIPIANPEEVAEVLWLGAHELKYRDDLLGSLPEFLEALESGSIVLRK